MTDKDTRAALEAPVVGGGEPVAWLFEHAPGHYTVGPEGEKILVWAPKVSRSKPPSGDEIYADRYRNITPLGALSSSQPDGLRVAANEVLDWLDAALECKKWHWDPQQWEAADHASKQLRAALSKPQAPEGCVLVPREPTEAMRIAALNTPDPEFVGDFPLYEKIWRAMLSAAPALSSSPASGWRDIESAPKGLPSFDVGCRESSKWFEGRVAPKYQKPSQPPVVTIRRRAWPHENSWQDREETNYVPDFFDAWRPSQCAPCKPY